MFVVVLHFHHRLLFFSSFSEEKKYQEESLIGKKTVYQSNNRLQIPTNSRTVVNCVVGRAAPNGHRIREKGKILAELKTGPSIIRSILTL